MTKGSEIDELSKIVDYLEAKVPASMRPGCGRKGCVFYLEMLVAVATGKMEGIPEHSCLGIVGPFGPGNPDGGTDIARASYARELLSRHPKLFEEMK
jgi:hypothetical protein